MFENEVEGGGGGGRGGGGAGLSGGGEAVKKDEVEGKREREGWSCCARCDDCGAVVVDGCCRGCDRGCGGVVNPAEGKAVESKVVVLYISLLVVVVDVGLTSVVPASTDVVVPIILGGCCCNWLWWELGC